MENNDVNRPRGFVPIGVFFVFGATMAAYAAATLLKPGTALDALWALNKTGHAQLVVSGPRRWPGLFRSFGAAVCRFHRMVPPPLLGMASGNVDHCFNATGDLINAARGEWLKGAVGVAIAGGLLLYMTSGGVRNYFRTARIARMLNDFNLLVDKFLVRFVRPRQLKRIRQHGLALLHAGNHVRTAKPVRLRQIGRTTIAPDGQDGSDRSRRYPRRAPALRAECESVLSGRCCSDYEVSPPEYCRSARRSRHSSNHRRRTAPAALRSTREDKFPLHADEARRSAD